MKQYKVIYYDGKERQAMYVRAKSLNDAMQQAKPVLASWKIIGATVLGAERVKSAEALSEIQERIKPISINSPTVKAILLKTQQLEFEAEQAKTQISRESRYKPLTAKQVTDILKHK